MDPNKHEPDTNPTNTEEALNENIQGALKQKRNFFRTKKFVVILILFIVISIFTAPVIFLLSLRGNDEAKNADTLNKALENPVIQKLAEQIPVPKITMEPITADSSIYLTPAPTLESIDDEFLRDKWKEYVNQENKFSLLYPENLSAHENPHGLGVVDISFEKTTGGDERAYEYQILIYPKTIGKLIGQDFDQLYALEPQSVFKMTSQNSTPQQFTKIVNVTVDDFRALRFRTTAYPPDPEIEAEVGAYIENENSVIILSTGENNLSDIDYMLTTFKRVMQ